MPEAHPKVSIIIPCFNAAKTLNQALDSCIQQELISFELLVIDGKSTDASISIIQSYGEKITHWISEKDRGVYDAINKGLNLAKGEWVYVLGSDDRLNSKDTLHQLLLNVSPKTKLIYGNIQNEDTQHRLVPTEHSGAFSKALYWRNTLHQQGALYHRDLFSTFRFDANLRVLADYDFHLNLLQAGIRAEYKPLLIAICKAGGLSKKFTSSLYKEEWCIKKRQLPFFIVILNALWIPMKYLGKSLFSKAPQ